MAISDGPNPAPTDGEVAAWASGVDPKFGGIVASLLGVDQEDDR